MNRTPIKETEFYQQAVKDVRGAREGGAIFIIDAEDARKGVGKTVCAIALAKLFAAEFDYELHEDDLVLGGEAYLNRLRDHPSNQVSAVVWDEAVGAGSGDARRSMAEQNRVLGQAWQTLRTKKILQFVTLPTWNDLDVRLRRFADYRVWCQREPIGCFQAYQIGVPFEGDGLRTEGLGPDNQESPRRIFFPNLASQNDPHYGYISEQKQTLIQADTFDADDVEALADGGDEADEEPDPEEIERREQIKTAIRAVRPWSDERGMSRRDAAKLVDYSYSWVRNRLDEWDEGQHRDIVSEDEVLTA